MLDVHGVKGSQNGYESSGFANRTSWLSETEFSHYSMGEWMGPWDKSKGEYKEIKKDNIDWALDTVQGLLDEWGKHPALYAIQPVNEPWALSDMDTLFKFYQDARKMIKD